MLLEMLIAVPLPVRESQRLPTPLVRGLRNLLLEGVFQDVVEVPEVTPAGALARLYQLVRTLDPDGRPVLGSGALEAFDALEQAAPPPDLGALPEGWAQGLADGTLRFRGETAALELTLSGRLVTRTRPGEPALRLVLRAVYRGLFPAPRVDPHADWDPGYEGDLLYSLRQPQALRDLRALLVREGEALAETIASGLEGFAAGPPETLTRILSLETLGGLEGLVQGFSPEALRAITAAGAAFDRIAPSIDEVYRLDPDGRLMVWRGQERAFSAVDGEVAYVA